MSDVHFPSAAKLTYLRDSSEMIYYLINCGRLAQNHIGDLRDVGGRLWTEMVESIL